MCVERDHSRELVLKQAGVAMVDALVVAQDIELWNEWLNLLQRTIAAGNQRLRDAPGCGEDRPYWAKRSPEG
jgi:hypothetical protein